MNGRDSEDPRAPLSQKQDTRGHGTGGTLKRGRGRDAERANRRGIRERRPLSFFSPPPPVSRENRGSCSASPISIRDARVVPCTTWTNTLSAWPHTRPSGHKPRWHARAALEDEPLRGGNFGLLALLGRCLPWGLAQSRCAVTVTVKPNCARRHCRTQTQPAKLPFGGTS